MRNAAHGSVLTKDKVFQARFGDKVLCLFVAESISLTHHVAKQDPLTVGTKTMNPLMDFHPAFDLSPCLGDNVEHTGLDWLNMAKCYEAEPYRTLLGLALQMFPTRFRRVSDGGTSKGPDLRAPVSVSDGFPTGFRRVSDAFPTGSRQVPAIYEILCALTWNAAMLHEIELPKYYI